MPDFDILGSGPGLYGSLGSAPSSGFDVIAPNAGGRPMNGQGQGQQQQPGAPISGLVAGALGLPTTQGANPGTAYLAQGQGQQAGGGQGQQPQQMSGLMAGILGLPQPGQAIGQQGQMQPNGGQGGPLSVVQQGAQQPSTQLASGMGGLLRAMIYNGQSQDV